jgi:hypothetical protein
MNRNNSSVIHPWFPWAHGCNQYIVLVAEDDQPTTLLKYIQTFEHLKELIREYPRFESANGCIQHVILLGEDELQSLELKYYSRT